MRAIVFATALLVVVVLGPGCGGDGGGEPITGTLVIDWGTDHLVPSVGTTFENREQPTEMWVLLGTAGLDCGTDYESPIPQGTHVMFSVDRTTPGSHAPLVTVIRAEPRSARFRGRSGSVVIDAIGETGDRIAGSVMVETTDDVDGRVAAAGTFDVMRCF